MRGRVGIALIVAWCAVFLAASSVSAATLTWTGGAGSDLWSAPGNWDLNRIPASSDSVVIPVGNTARIPTGTSVSIVGASSAGTLILDGGSLAVSGSASFTGTLDLRTGQLSASGASAQINASATV